MNESNMHYGPTGAINEQVGADASPSTFLGTEFKPKDLDTWEQDSRQVLEISPEQGPNNLNMAKQVSVGIHNK
jgi:hypothetical protein